jgi:hypothetical protein
MPSSRRGGFDIRLLGSSLSQIPEGIVRPMREISRSSFIQFRSWSATPAGPQEWPSSRKGAAAGPQQRLMSLLSLPNSSFWKGSPPSSDLFDRGPANCQHPLTLSRQTAPRDLPSRLVLDRDGPKHYTSIGPETWPNKNHLRSYSARRGKGKVLNVFAFPGRTPIFANALSRLSCGIANSECVVRPRSPMQCPC